MNRPPNILLIMTDQQRFDSLGCYGSTWTHTPNLDRLAAEGIQFDHCYTNNPICTPARASLMTGKELPGHGVYQLHDILPANEVLFTERLQELGYRTALFGKLHVSGRIEEAQRRHPHDGFDVYEYCCEPALDLDSPLNGYGRWLKHYHADYYQLLKAKGRDRGHDPVDVTMNRWATDGAMDFMRAFSTTATAGDATADTGGSASDTGSSALDTGGGALGSGGGVLGSGGGAMDTGGGAPFFCKISMFDPHNPYANYPLEMERYVDRSSIPAPVPAASLDGGDVEAYACDAERKHSYLGPVASFPEEAIREMRAGYAAMVAHIDLEVGRVLEFLERSGLADNTLVIFTSDHGDMLGDHGTLVKGAMLYDPCVRVPLIMRRPGVFQGGARRASLVQLHDLAATCLAAAGVAPADLARWMPDARNLAADASGRYDAFRDFAVCPYRNSGINDRGRYWDPAIDTTMVRRGRWKLHAYHPVAGVQDEAVYLLFDMDADPQERNNLAGNPAHAAVLVQLKEDLMAWLLKFEVRNAGRGGAALPKKDQLIKNALEFEATVPSRSGLAR
jgi:arylsulfatase A-like enzyme